MTFLGIFGVPNVEKLKARGDVGAIIKALGYMKDKDVRVAAATALAEMGAGDAVEPVTKALTDEEVQVRLAAAEALDRLGWAPEENRAGAAYHAAKNEWDRCAAIGTPAVEPLLIAMRDVDPDVAQGATSALEKIGEPAAERLTPLLSDEPLQSMVIETLSRIGKPAIGVLIASLTSEDVNTHWPAIQVLARIGEPAVPPLIAALRDEDQQLRKAAARALGRIPGPAIGPLSELLTDPNADVRAQAASVLGDIGDPEPLHLLIGMLGESVSVNRAAAADALGKIADSREGDSVFCRALHEHMGTGTKGVNVSLNANYALGAVAGKRAIEFFALGTKKAESDAPSESTVVAVLDPLLKAIRDSEEEVRDASAIALAKLGRIAVGHLLDFLTDQDASVRAHTAIALGGIADVRAIEPLLNALEDTSAAVRASAALALGMMEDSRCIDPLIGLLQSDQTELVWTASALSLGLAKGEAAVKILQTRVMNQDMRVASACSAALGMLGHPVE
jgi:HEAT repeat protein